ncbi:MAG: hypothetical protein WC736_14625 [Gallionella sp.]|jgi:hypothetical protein
MSYKVKCLSTHGADQRTSVNPSDEDYHWSYGEVKSVADALIGNYRDTTAWSVLGHNGVLDTAYDGLEVVSGLAATDIFDGVTHQTTFVLTDVAQAVVNGTEYQSTKLFNFPLGRINVLGVVATIAQKTTSAIAGTLNAGAVGALGIGTAAASATTLATTMVDLLPSTAFASSTVINVAGTAVSSALAASAQFDGTVTAKDVYVNTAYATTTDVDADATQTLTGTITITWSNLGTV